VREWKPAFYHDVLKTEEHIKRCANMSAGSCFTIVYKEGKSREHNLVGPDEETARIWIKTIKEVLRNFKTVKQDKQFYVYV
jgi:hypothetical protein